MMMIMAGPSAWPYRLGSVIQMECGFIRNAIARQLIITCLIHVVAWSDPSFVTKARGRFELVGLGGRRGGRPWVR